MLYPSMLVCLITAVTLLYTFASVRAATNTTWDDVNLGISYSPTSAWIDQTTYPGFLNPDLFKMYQRTWHAASTSSNEEATLSVTFKGSCIYVYGLIWEDQNTTYARNDFNYTIDGGYRSGLFTHSSPSGASNTMVYDALFVAESGMTEAAHTLVINIKPSSSFVLDRMTITYEIPATTDKTISPETPNCPPEGFKNSAIIGAAVGGTLGGIMLGLLLGFCIFCRHPADTTAQPVEWQPGSTRIICSDLPDNSMASLSKYPSPDLNRVRL